MIRLITSTCVLAAAMCLSVGDRVGASTVSTGVRVARSFEKNEGQFDASVRFLTRGKRSTLVFTDEGAELRVKDGRRPVVYWTHNGGKETAVEGRELMHGRANYLIGRDRSKWRTNVPLFAQVRYRDVVPGIDIVYHDHEGGLEFDVVAAPGSDPRSVHLTFSRDVTLDRSGNATIDSGDDALVLSAPIIYQQDGPRRRRIDGRLVLRGAREVGFEVSEYDTSRPLVIDPVLTASTWFGSSYSDIANSLATDKAGAIYVSGATYGSDFPVEHPLYTGSGGNGFVAKFSPDASELLFATYFGGTGFSGVTGIAVDDAGAMYIVGETDAPDLPVVNAPQPALHGSTCTPQTVAEYACGDGYVAKIRPDGSALEFSTYLGGNWLDHPTSVAVDSDGAPYVAGFTYSRDFPLSNAADASFNGTGCTRVFLCVEGFVLKLTPDGSTIAYSTFVGGSLDDAVAGVAVDGMGRAYFAGDTTSEDVPVANAFQPACRLNPEQPELPCQDAFVGRLSASGAAFDFLTYLGGEKDDGVTGVGLFMDSAYVAGHTRSLTFPTRNALQPTPGGAFVAKFTPDGAGLVFSTYLGGPNAAVPYQMAVDRAGNPSIAGRADSSDFPVVRAYQRGFTGVASAFVTTLAADGRRLLFSTFLGGPGSMASAIAVDSSGAVVVAGEVSSDPPGAFPTFPNAFRRDANDTFETFTAKFLPPASTAILTYDAGTGEAGRAIAGEYGTRARLGSPFHVAVDSAGNRYVADAFNNQVLIIGTDNIVRVAAGNGQRGYSGDHGGAVAASLNSPYGVAVDEAGNVYIADTGNHCVRMISNGIIRTIAGTGVGGFSGDGGPATSAMLLAPTGVAASHGFLYIADTYNHRIRRVDVNGTITTIAGGMAGELNTPTGVAVEASGAVLIANWGGHTVLRAAGGAIEIVAGTGTAGFSGDGGPASHAQLNGPFGVAVDAARRILIADELNHRVRVVVAGTIATLAGNGTAGADGISGKATAAQLSYPVDVAADTFDNLFISDLGNHRVVRVFEYAPER
jgi:hypothetical protein